MKGMKVFAGSTGVPFAKRMCQYLGEPLGQSETLRFSDGNTFVRVGETVRGQDVYLVQPIGLQPNDEFVEILFWIDAFRRAGANSVTVVIPYFGYAKGDKKDEPRVSLRARVCAESMELAGADRLIMMDLHSPQIQGFFKKPVDHLLARPVLCHFIRQLGWQDYVIVSPDAGFTKQARKFSSLLDVPTVIGDKHRAAHNEQADILELIGDVKGKNAVIVDDFSTSGGTLAGLANTLKAHGAGRIAACLSHLLLSEAGVRRLELSPIERVLGTDTVPNPLVKTSNLFQVISVAPLFAEAIRRIDGQESVSELFDRIPESVVQAAQA